MCTCVAYYNGGSLLGRNLDVDTDYGEKIIITPRAHAFISAQGSKIGSGAAIIGIGTLIDGYPMYFDAVNEHGLAMAALNFVGNAKYKKSTGAPNEVAVYELIPYILRNAKNTDEARAVLEKIIITDTPPNDKTPVAELHWTICDKNGSVIAVESVTDGVKIYDNPVGVMTNNPPFPFHLDNLSGYMNLTAAEPHNRFSSKIELLAYSRGMGAIGLPGDLSSASRFVRAAFIKLNITHKKSTAESKNALMHVLSAVEQQSGCAVFGGKSEITAYSAVIDLENPSYSFKTYSNSRIREVVLNERERMANEPILYPIYGDNDVLRLNPC